MRILYRSGGRSFVPWCLAFLLAFLWTSGAWATAYVVKDPSDWDKQIALNKDDTLTIHPGAGSPQKPYGVQVVGSPVSIAGPGGGNPLANFCILVTAESTLTIQDLNIDAPAENSGIDFLLGGTLTVKGKNTITRSAHKAGIHAAPPATLNINSNGTLNILARKPENNSQFGGGAGIGGNGGQSRGITGDAGEPCGAINIWGSVRILADGGSGDHGFGGGGGAGIGGGGGCGANSGLDKPGGTGGNGGNVTVSGSAAVTVSGGEGNSLGLAQRGAGIGGGGGGGIVAGKIMPPPQDGRPGTINHKGGEIVDDTKK